MSAQGVITMADKWYWYHLTASTYGSWLHGDQRGFRTKHHRKHIEGDYKHRPPPGMYAHLERRSKQLLKQDPVCLTPEWRALLGAALRDRLVELGAEVLCLAVCKQHVHIQAKLPFGKPRAWLGIAKKHAWFIARDAGWKVKLWAQRSKATPVEDRQHQVNLYRYIRKHFFREAAWFWSAIEKPLTHQK
jgi:hypothetical protein